MTKRKTGIYLLRIGRVKYVGQAKDIADRWARHQYDMSRNCHHNRDVQAQYNKGRLPKFEIIVQCPVFQLDPLEAIWARLLSNCDQRAPRITVWSFFPALHWKTLVDWVLWSILGWVFLQFVK